MYSTKLNNELNIQTYWDLIRIDMKDQGISLNVDSKSIISIYVTCKQKEINIIAIKFFDNGIKFYLDYLD